MVFAWAIGLGFEAHRGWSLVSGRSWCFLALSGLATRLSWLCYFRALQFGPASSVAPIDKLSVVLVVLGAWVLLEERLTLLKATGISLIAADAIILTIVH